MNRLSLFGIIMLFAASIVSSCSSGSIKGYEWLDGKWEGTIPDVSGKPCNWAEVEIKNGKYTLTAAPELPYFKNGKSVPIKINKMYNDLEGMVVLALDESGMLSIDEDAMRLVVTVDEFSRINLNKQGGNPMSSTGTGNAQANGADFASTASASYAVDGMVYSNAYDGYLNMRASASSKAAIVGTFRNGSVGAQVLGTSGSWSKILYNGVEGYVYTQYLSDIPTLEVTSNVTADALEGVWDIYGNGDTFYVIYNNGRFLQYSIYFNEGGYTQQGTWCLVGNSIAFTVTSDFVDNGSYGTTTSFNITPSGSIEGMKRYNFVTEEELNRARREYESIDGFMITKKEFNKYRNGIK